MSTLAQRIVECRLDEYEALRAKKIEAARSRLLPLWEGNHVVTAHRSLSEIVARDAEQAAARFVLDDSIARALSQLLHDDESVDAALRHAHAPSPSTWIETGKRSGDGAFGVLLEASGTFREVNFTAFEDGPDGSIEVGLVGVMDFSRIEDGQIQLIDFKDEELATQTTGFIIATCAFLSIPGAVERTGWHYSPAQQKKRMKARRPPLLSFNKVTLRLPRKSGTSRGASCDAAGPVRRHQVMGHHRVLDRNTRSERLTWVIPHWRGDAAAGVVLKERTIST
ncbi:hypothetical protein [Minwuia thermotolerans]|uniref:Uncharacterized protein n=1 Tax=Minwuia thermotolerans TaxID=2056226 RepID=A0A2M9G2L4_9PROT|nr:hypothetical protein [Minwuia thermotolerans]PJK29948.1 hypothetical protein CVT23_09270 [Minwuia thermotolerans]